MHTPAGTPAGCVALGKSLHFLSLNILVGKAGRHPGLVLAQVWGQNRSLEQKAGLQPPAGLQKVSGGPLWAAASDSMSLLATTSQAGCLRQPILQVGTWRLRETV